MGGQRQILKEVPALLQRMDELPPITVTEVYAGLDGTISDLLFKTGPQACRKPVLRLA
jgi:hypothetical protein